MKLKKPYLLLMRMLLMRECMNWQRIGLLLKSWVYVQTSWQILMLFFREIIFTKIFVILILLLLWVLRMELVLGMELICFHIIAGMIGGGRIIGGSDSPIVWMGRGHFYDFFFNNQSLWRPEKRKSKFVSKLYIIICRSSIGLYRVRYYFFLSHDGENIIIIIECSFL